MATLVASMALRVQIPRSQIFRHGVLHPYARRSQFCVRSALPLSRQAFTSTLHPSDIRPNVSGELDRPPANKPAHGGIELIMGPMFAGKSSELLRRVERLEAAGLTVALVKSSKDSRYSNSHVVTHDGVKKACYAVPSLEVFRSMAGDRWAKYQVVAVDEAQFFPDLFHICSSTADGEGKLWVLAGLDGDFMRQRFGQMLDLVPHADSVTKLTARCQYCAQSGVTTAAPFTVRFSVADQRQEVVGGAERYAAVCRQHFGRMLGHDAAAPEGDADAQAAT
ncbi:THK1 [Auxenochlorella protothecoides x Auxenochlorella symbiontica]|uniref:Thymidine kinase n=2 Tax=Auxenochlorella protothecoides TaxID=3075 RepID=A0A1D1ZNX1_AUXPR